MKNTKIITLFKKEALAKGKEGELVDEFVKDFGYLLEKNQGKNLKNFDWWCDESNGSAIRGEFHVDVVRGYWESRGCLENLIENSYGEFEDWEDFARERVESLSGAEDWLLPYIDFSALGDDLQSDYEEISGVWFSF